MELQVGKIIWIIASFPQAAFWREEAAALPIRRVFSSHKSGAGSSLTDPAGTKNELYRHRQAQYK